MLTNIVNHVLCRHTESNDKYYKVETVRETRYAVDIFDIVDFFIGGGL